MQTHAQTAPTSKRTLWIGRIISAVTVLFLVFDGFIKLVNVAPVEESFVKLGYPANIALGIGILELACVALYVVPGTSVLGAILLTGYLGGGVATHLRVGDPLPTHVFFPIYIGVLIWGGLFLRERQLWALVPLRKRPDGLRTAAGAIDSKPEVATYS